ncbi:uncharacterized protein T551_01728 [Pneumocystis jirovecii RU7]|uniref:RAVE complex protein Rav1 C-terminal domain-containing protein n=1 Tax=Pneumocystis jirovecii (strain RU7) TaxID=1408657 RepID=A0A0W4ZQ10_PNEJ7|nr:uncharacterized protein T551_01728 [Pneumocystis jirovecii RU7]KTW30445.1 hypothetical protein T551_01728 [Pneumocystis jirovecii RU7]
MQSVYPGAPLASYHTFSAEIYNNIPLVAYVSGTSISIFINGKKITQVLSIETTATAVAIDKRSGKICVSSKSNIYIFDIAKKTSFFWYLKLTFTINNETISTLSWGNKEEILIGGNYLHLYSPNVKKGKIIWSQKLSNPVIFTLMSPNATLIATISEADHFIKVWEKPLLYESIKSIKFVYLPHPKPITSMRWKQNSNNNQEINNILYSMSQDTILRIWIQENASESCAFQLSYIVDIRKNTSLFKIPSNDLGENSSCLIIDNNTLVLSLHSITESTSNKEINQLIEMRNNNSDICLAFDENGQMWVFALSFYNNKGNTNIGIIPISATKMSNLYIPKYLKHTEYFAIPANKQKNGININLYFLYFGENIDLYQINFLNLINSTSENYKFKFEITWTGHRNPIKSLIKCKNSNILLSKAYDKTVLIWKINYFNKSENLQRLWNLKLKESPKHITVINEKKFIILDSKNISILEIKDNYTNIIATCNNVPSEIVLCFIHLEVPLELPENILINNTYFLAVTATKNLWIWKLSSKTKKKQNKKSIYIKKFQEFSLPHENDLHLVLLINSIKHNLYSSKEIFITISITGQLKVWSKNFLENGKLCILPNTKSLETKIIKPKMISEFSKKLAIICQKGKELTIWDIQSLEFSDVEEYRHYFSNESEISNLDWTYFKNSQLILAVGFKYKIILICQARCSYDIKKSWFLFRSFDISNITNNLIQHLVFLNNTTLVIGSKNQLFLYNKINDDINTTNMLYKTDKEHMRTLFKGILSFNTVLPVYHPLFLEQLLLIGDMKNVKTILINLYRTIYSFEKINIIDKNKIEIKDSFLGIPIYNFLEKKNHKKKNNKTQSSYYYQLFNIEENVETRDEIIFDTILSQINDRLLSYTIINLSPSEQLHLTFLIKCIKNIEFHKNSIDTNGIRYYLFFLKSIYLSNNKEEANMPIKNALWAFHSDSQETLLYLINQECEKNFNYIQMDNSYCFFWLRNKENLKIQMETIAHKKYITNSKNPEFCSLFYIALKKKNILLRLWKIATGHSSQKVMVNFLSNDFSETRWKIAAQKNAYVLLGKHHYEYSAAFFLLAEKLQDAVNVCIKNLHNISLAIAISRVYEGDNGQTFKNILINHIIPNAIKVNDRWLACWAFWMLGKKDLSIKSLILPLSSLLEKDFEVIIPINSKETITEDPTLIILYKELKNKNIQIFRENQIVSQYQEFKFILYITRLYIYIGCDILALNLIQGWNFTNHWPQAQEKNFKYNKNTSEKNTSEDSYQKTYQIIQKIL